jgi:opacity protein-like surface antigen
MPRPHASLSAALALSAVALLASSSPAHAVDWEAGGHLVYAEPRAEFAAVVEQGFGIHGFGVVFLDPTGFLGLRLDGGFLNYGNEEVQVPLSSTVQRVVVDVNTSNNIALLNIGIEVSAPSGPVRPYAFGSIGLGYFFTESSVSGSNSSDVPFASTRNFDDTTTGTTLGGGLRIPVAGRISVDLGVEYRRYTNARYLAEGDIVEESDGGVTLLVNETDAELVMYRLGVAFRGQ